MILVFCQELVRLLLFLSVVESNNMAEGTSSVLQFMQLNGNVTAFSLS